MKEFDIGDIRRSNKNPGPRPEAYSTSVLSPRVADIAAEDDDELHLCTEYVKDFYKYKFLRQTQVFIQPFFMDSQVEVEPLQRARFADRMIVIHNLMKFVPETLFLAVSLMDNYIQERTLDMDNMELLSKAALYVAAKYQEPEKSKWQACFIHTINAVQETEQRHLLRMEEEILWVTDWNLARTLSLHFLRRNCKAAKASTEEELTAMYILELCLIEYTMTWVKPSRQAAGALYCAFRLLGRRRNCWNQQVEYCSGHSLLTLRPLVMQMAKLILEAPEKVWAPYEKYSSDKYGHVGCSSETMGRRLSQMATGIF